MSTKSRFINGDHNTYGDISGQKHKRSECVYNWKDQLVHKRDYEPKQPQLTIRARQDHIAVTDGTRSGGQDPALLNAAFTASDII